jgi:hypothetical protein
MSQSAKCRVRLANNIVNQDKDDYGEHSQFDD